MLVDYDYKVTTIKNPFALEYKTIEIHNPEELRDEIAKGIVTPHRFVFTPDTEEDMNTYRSIMNVNLKNSNIKYIVNVKEEPVVGVKEDPEEKKHTGIEPISSLIEYIQSKYQVDTTKEIKEYESKINKE